MRLRSCTQRLALDRSRSARAAYWRARHAAALSKNVGLGSRVEVLDLKPWRARVNVMVNKL
jgi:hypothetical protein